MLRDGLFSFEGLLRRATAVAAALLVPGCNLLFPLHEGSIDGLAPDANAGGDAGRFCATAPPPNRLLCADFDGELGEGWNPGPYTSGPAQLDRDSKCVSPPFSLVTTATPLNAGEQGADLVHTVPGSYSHLVFTFKLLVETMAPSAQGVVAEVDTGTHSLEFVAAQRPYVEQYVGKAYTSFTVTKDLPLGQYTEIRLDLWYAKKSLVVSFDDVPVLTAALADDAPSAATDPTVRLGLVYMPTPTPGLTARFDNVTVDAP